MFDHICLCDLSPCVGVFMAVVTNQCCISFPLLYDVPFLLLLSLVRNYSWLHVGGPFYPFFHFLFVIFIVHEFDIESDLIAYALGRNFAFFEESSIVNCKLYCSCSSVYLSIFEHVGYF